ncbi:hypothetical protein [Enterobacter roggenkampii]|uniref:hypothetical protein n=1 Tax=Enterobacter roggenkampii TaxID=1812935 RepID=UPI00240959B1|nr:hypothetical protein [Enterobacter roggenkampii]WFC89824.1 hypothetical protein OM420_14910 [Enterobacter roggenkampii]
MLKQDSAETFQKVLRFLLYLASKLVFLISEFRDTAHFFFIELNFAEVQQVSFSQGQQRERQVEMPF